MRKAMVVLGTGLLTFAGTGQAHAAEPVAVALPTGCTLTYAGALTTDVLVNSPVHVGVPGGLVSVGGFTPSAFIGGAVTPTWAYVGCI